METSDKKIISLKEQQEKEIAEIKNRHNASLKALEGRFNQEMSRVRNKHRSQLEALQRERAAKKLISEQSVTTRH